VAERREQFKRLIEAIKRLVDQEEKDAKDRRKIKAKKDPPHAHHLPHKDAMWFVQGAELFLNGKATSLESALGLKRGRGRRAGRKPKSLELAEEALRLRKQGMKLEDIALKLFGHRPNPPSVQHVQVLMDRATPVIKERETKRIVDELHRRQDKRSQTPPRLAPKGGKIQIKAIWVDPTRRPTPKRLMRRLRRRVGTSRAKKQRDPD
jgi:hypothetical protein